MIYSYYNNFGIPQDYRKDSATTLKPFEALKRGNLFDSEYQSYGSYIPSLPSVKGEQEQLMRDIQMYTTASQDLKLYLDIHPKDSAYFALFSDFSKKVNNYVKDYENKYNPIFAGNAKFLNNYFTWISSPSIFYNN